MNTTDIKKNHTQKVFQVIYDEKIISKANIAQTLGISIPTVTQCVNELKSCGLIRDDYHYESNVGRKAAAIMSLPNCRVAIGVEIHKQGIRMAAVNIYGEILAEESLPLPYSTKNTYYMLLGNAINNFFISCNFTKDIFLGVGIAVQGIPNRQGTKMIYGKILDNLSFNLAELEPYVHFSCTLRHDTEAMSDYALWNYPNIQDCCFLHMDINLGGILIIDRAAHWGTHMPSGIIEHIIIKPGGKLCYCGKCGCAEAYCSTVSLLDGTNETLASFFSKLRDGHKEYQEKWRNFLQNLAFLLDNIQLMFSTEVILSGRLAAYITEEDLALLNRFLDNTFYQNVPRPEIILSKYNDNAVGAAIYYINQFLMHPVNYD